MNRPFSTAFFEYCDGPERRVLDLGLDGIPSVPAFGCSHYSSSYPIVEKHVHPGCVEIIYCAGGNLYFDCEDEEYMLMPGEILVVQPDIRHRLSVNPKGMVDYWLYFRLEPDQGTLLKQPGGEAAELQSRLAGIPLKIFRAAPRVHSAFQHLFDIYDSMERGAFRSLSMRATVLELLLAVIESAQCGRSQRCYKSVEKVIDLIKSSPEMEFDWDVIVQECNISKSLFISRFKELTGLPPHAYVIFCRMKRARSMLQDKTSSVTDIAYKLGFSSSQHFAMQFKRQFGMTPTQWRSENRDKK